MRLGEVLGERIGEVFHMERTSYSRPEIISKHSPESISRALSNGLRTPGLLRHSPIDPVEQIGQLRGRDRHRAIGHRRPNKASALQPFREQASPLAVVPDQFYS